MRTRHIGSSSDLVPSEAGESSAIKRHQPVLLQEAIDELSIQANDTVVDATLGGAGHAKAITDLLGAEGAFVGFDLDLDALARAQVSLQGVAPQTLFIEANFRYIERELMARGITHIDKALFDLGWSAYQLDAGRGFSFLTDEPLLMTFEKNPRTGTLTAATIVNKWDESSIADIIFGWGEERYARRIAQAIVRRRGERPFTRADELAAVIKSAVPAAYRTGRLHPATRTFQALRIAVNDELGALTEGLKSVWKLLAPGGRIAVITFHSIEDRLVKELFLEWERAGGAVRITRSPKKPTRKEVVSNPRARSAKARVIEKI
ncbi:MAG TPA: 16S rRNA (cytosine(1402)-N(4))-methyltransferase RsmH [Candidatus Paceibacterota bacterium]|nr:16S rRNA (cytosine(1402)-N(4))-methyltransferase RsmH [Candidatus Paceibacterota bacterium]